MKKSITIFLVSALLIASTALGVFAWNEHERVKSLELQLKNSHNHAFNELVTGISELDNSLQKSLYATSPGIMSAVCTDVYGKAMTAQMSLGALPFSTQELEKTAGFISQVGDYAYSLSRSGDAYTEEQLQNLRELAKTATQLSENFKKIQVELAEGGLSMEQLVMAESELDKAEESAIPDELSGGMRMIEQEFPEIPSLIYDGPFSEHIKDSHPKLLENDPKISESEAQAIAAEFVGISKEKLQSMGKSDGLVPCYYFSTDYMSIQVTEQGGKVLNFLSSHSAKSASISKEDANTIAKTFLTERGIESMKESYHMIRNNICTMNFAFEQDGVVCYPDLVKVSVALDTGMVVGFESGGYIASHTEREIPAAAVSEEEAKKHVTSDLTIESHSMCIIPTAGKHERFCHEFVCSSADGGSFIIYVNAETGEQEKILILLEDENGSLTL